MRFHVHGKFIYFFLSGIVFLVFSCAYNPAVFDTSGQSRFIPDTVNYEDIYLKNSSGLQLHSCFFKTQSAPRGTVFLFPGNSGDISLWYDVISVMLRNGFQVFSFEYQGIGKSEGKPTQKNVLEDSQMFLKYLGNRLDVSQTRLIFWGFDLGAGLAVKLAFDNPGVADYIILDSPYTSKREISLAVSPWYLKPFLFPFCYSPYSPGKLVSRIGKTPVLVVHSVEDQVIPYRMGEELYNLADKPKLFFESLGPHGYALVDYEKLYMERVDKLLTYK
jgi:uncharacterized protein